MGVKRKLQVCYRDLSGAFQSYYRIVAESQLCCFRNVTVVLQGYLQNCDWERGQGCCSAVTEVLQQWYIGVTGVLEVCQRNVTWVLQGFYIDLTRVLHCMIHMWDQGGTVIFLIIIFLFVFSYFLGTFPTCSRYFSSIFTVQSQFFLYMFFGTFCSLSQYFPVTFAYFWIIYTFVYYLLNSSHG